MPMIELFYPPSVRETEPETVNAETIDAALRAGTFERYSAENKRGFVEMRARRVCGVAGDPEFVWDRNAGRWELIQ